MPKDILIRFRQYAAMKKLLEGAGAVAHSVLHVRIYFAKGLFVAIGNEDRIIAETAKASGRKSETAIYFTLENLGLALRHRHRKSADKFGREIVRFFLQQFPFHPGHGNAKILVGTGPVRRVDSRRAVEGVHPQP